jgi:hypothetical protein
VPDMSKVMAQTKRVKETMNLKHQTKCMLYKTLARPVLTYGSECWPLWKEDGHRL